MKEPGKPTWTLEEVRYFREVYREGRITVREISETYRVSFVTVQKMLRGETYAEA